MSKGATENNDKARFWLLLKQAWDAWKKGNEMPALDDDAQAYFEAIAFERFSHALGHAALAHVPRVATPKEAWAHVLAYLVTQRPVSRHYLLDDLFARARARAAAYGVLAAEDEIALYVGWLLKQFQMRMRDIVKAYAREFGTQAEVATTGSLDAPLGGPAGEKGQTLGDILTGEQSLSWEELASLESRAIGPAVADRYFPGIRPDFKLSIFLRSIKLRRCVTISCTEDAVLNLAGVGHAVFAQGAKWILEKDFPFKVLALPQCVAMDRYGKYEVCLSATRHLLDLVDEWLWIGSWLNELGAHRSDLTAREFAARAEAFVSLLAERLKEAGDNSSEIQIKELFSAIEGLLLNSAIRPV
jgi:hypothetical protein